MNPVTKTFKYGDQNVTLETGRIARQATGSVLVTVENTSVLCTVVAEKQQRARQEERCDGLRPCSHACSHARVLPCRPSLDRPIRGSA